MEQEIQAFTLEEARETFDRLTLQMSQIAESRLLAPVEHSAFYDAALLACYGKAYELLRQRSDLGRYYRDLEAPEVENADTLLREQKSLKKLQSYVTDGLITNTDCNASEAVVSAWDRVERSAQAQAFKQLFSDAVALEPLPIEVGPADVEDEAAEDQDDPNSINTLDIMELVEEHTFTEAEEALIRCALGTNPVDLTKLRREMWEIIALPKIDYDALVANFSDFRVAVAAFLHTANIPAVWVKDTRNAGEYRLLIGPEAENYASTRRDPKAGLRAVYGSGFEALPDRKRIAKTGRPTTQDRPTDVIPATLGKVKEKSEDKQLLQYIQAIIDEQTATSNGQPPRLTLIGRIVADSHTITHAEVCGKIKEFVDSGALFYGRNRKGSRTVVNAVPVDLEVRARAIRRDFATETDTNIASDDTERSTALTAQQFDIAARSLSCLVAAGHQNKGLTVKSLSLQLEIPEPELRPVLSKLVQRGVLKRETKWTRSRSPHSSKKEEMYLKFKDQETWDLFKAGPRDFVLELVENSHI